MISKPRSGPPDTYHCQPPPVPGIGLQGFGMASVERTAYPRFKRLITVRELLFFATNRQEMEWAAARTDSDGHRLALLVLKSCRRMGVRSAVGGVTETVVDFVRRAVELPEGVVAGRGAEKTAKSGRAPVGDFGTGSRWRVALRCHRGSPSGP
ncbi:DUF4158 domain-containing protein [Kitasatospora hibisci]|uniref:DUF4158 domain-containing protein n=1 Tax=Kitasatospora hibisci TaxID=3369522 RepID=UPI003754EBBA